MILSWKFQSQLLESNVSVIKEKTLTKCLCTDQFNDHGLSRIKKCSVTATELKSRQRPAWQ